MANETLGNANTTSRNHLCLEAVWELDKLARVMPGLVPVDDDQSHFAVRGICGRMLRLTSVLMSGLSDELVSEEEMRRILYFEGASQG